MKTIVIAYDGSEGSEAIFTELQHAGLPSELDTHIVAVVNLWGMPVTFEALPSTADEQTESMRQASALAERGAARLRATFPKWRVTAAGLAGSVAHSILERAREVCAEVIFIGSHSRSAIGRLFLGSVSQKVVGEAKCSVRICRPRAQSGSVPRLLVAVDGSSSSQSAVRCVSVRTWSPGTVVAVVNVIEPPFWAGLSGLPPEQVAEFQRQHDATLRWLGTVTTDSQLELESVGFVVERYSLEGEPKSTLLEWAERWNADCLFIGSSGLHYGDRRTLGTVASALTVRAHCSVEIVRTLNGV